MKTFKYLLIGLCVQAVCAGNLFAASTTYFFSGHLDQVEDRNNLAGGISRVYPDGIGVGTLFSAWLTLNDNLGALAGSMDFDIGGLYQGHLVVGGSSLVCKPGECIQDYNDPAYPLLAEVSIGGSLRSPGATNLPLAASPSDVPFSGGFVHLQIASNTGKPPANTRLSDLPVVGISLDLFDYFDDYRMIDCPGCVEGYTYQHLQQGWSLSGSSSAISAVPVPAAAWLFGSSLLGLLGMTRQRRS